MARGFIPAGLRSSPKTLRLGVSGSTRFNQTGLLRSPAGINPLATGDWSYLAASAFAIFAS
ncbi:protein of unknown function [Pseudomonas mediterranea]